MTQNPSFYTWNFTHITFGKYQSLKAYYISYCHIYWDSYQVVNKTIFLLVLTFMQHFWSIFKSNDLPNKAHNKIFHFKGFYLGVFMWLKWIVL